MHHLTDTAELAAELSAVDGVPLAEAQTLAAAHLGHITREAGAGTVCTNCGRYGHSSADCPRPPLPGGRTLYVVAADPPAPQPAPEPNPQPPYGPQRPFPARPHCSYCLGPHMDAECPLRRPVFVAISAPDSDPSDRPTVLHEPDLDADIVDWRGGYVLRSAEGDVTVSFGEQIWHLTLEQARELRALIALPQVRRLLTA